MMLLSPPGLQRLSMEDHGRNLVIGSTLLKLWICRRETCASTKFPRGQCHEMNTWHVKTSVGRIASKHQGMTYSARIKALLVPSSL
jgi:hypothetical protein